MRKKCIWRDKDDGRCVNPTEIHLIKQMAYQENECLPDWSLLDCVEYNEMHNPDSL
jgi:hypothetical protein